MANFKHTAGKNSIGFASMLLNIFNTGARPVACPARVQFVFAQAG